MFQLAGHQERQRSNEDAVRVGNRSEVLLSRFVRITTRFPRDLNPTV